MNTPQIAKDLYDQLQKSTPLILGRSDGDPDPAKRKYSVELRFRSLVEAQDFHFKLNRFASEWVTDEPSSINNLETENQPHAHLPLNLQDEYPYLERSWREHDAQRKNQPHV